MKKEIEEIFENFVKENKLKVNKKANFKDFLKFLEIDFYDWVKGNLRCYFREKEN